MAGLAWGAGIYDALARDRHGERQKDPLIPAWLTPVALAFVYVLAPWPELIPALIALGGPTSPVMATPSQPYLADAWGHLLRTTGDDQRRARRADVRYPGRDVISGTRADDKIIGSAR